MDTITACQELYNFWSKCQYGFEVDGKLMTPSNPEWEQHYKFQSYDEFMESRSGICWDYTNYGRHFLMKNHVPFKQYFMMCETPGYMTHTFILCPLEGSEKVVLVESAFKPIDEATGGVKTFENFREAVRFIASMMFAVNNYSNRIASFKYDVIQFTGHPPYHSTGKEYVEWMYHDGEIVYQSEARVEDYEYAVKESKKKKHMYFYHLLPKDVVLDEKGLKTPDYVYKVEGDRKLYLSMVDKYRMRLCNGWGIYPEKDPSELTPKEIYEGINKFRKDPHGNNQIYMFRYPPTPDLGPNMRDVLKDKVIYAFDILDPENKKYIESINWGYEGSHTDNEALTKEWYENISKKEYFEKYSDDDQPLFASLNHISIDPIKGYLPLSTLIRTKVALAEDSNGSPQQETYTEYVLTKKDRDQLDESEFGIEELRKYPLNDAEHVKMANTFFNKAPKQYKGILAVKILDAAKKFNINTENWETVRETAEKFNKSRGVEPEMEMAEEGPIQEAALITSNDESEIVKVFQSMHSQFKKFKDWVKYKKPEKYKPGLVQPLESFAKKKKGCRQDFVNWGYDFLSKKLDEENMSHVKKVYIQMEMPIPDDPHFLDCHTDWYSLIYEYDNGKVICTDLVYTVPVFRKSFGKDVIVAENLEKLYEFFMAPLQFTKETANDVKKPLHYRLFDYTGYDDQNKPQDDFESYKQNGTIIADGHFKPTMIFEAFMYPSDYCIMESESGLIKVDPKDISFDEVYFGSYKDFGCDMLKTGLPKLFVTPFKGIASIFTTDRRLYNNTGKPWNVNLAYREWHEDNPVEPFEEVHVTVEGAPDLRPRTFESSGYIYTIDISNLKDYIYQEPWMDADREFLICGLNEIKIKKVEVCKHLVHVEGAPAKPNNGISLAETTHIPITQENVDKFIGKSDKSLSIGLKHLRVNENVKGYIWYRGNNVIAYVAVEKQDEGNMIIALEVSSEYQNKGIGKQLLSFAEKEFKADHLSVNKKNDKAIKLYEDAGWEIYDESDYMFFMHKLGPDGKPKDENKPDHELTDEVKGIIMSGRNVADPNSKSHMVTPEMQKESFENLKKYIDSDKPTMTSFIMSQEMTEN